MNSHKYVELVNRLRANIQTGVYACGEKLPSENELSWQTGYSRQTVRHAMEILENEGYTTRVRGSGTYVKSSAGQRKATHNIAVVTTYISEYIFPAILHGIDHVLHENGYTPMLFDTRNQWDRERTILMDLLRKPIDGLIVEGTKTALPNPNIDLYEKLRAIGIPIVFFNACYQNLKDPICVAMDDYGGGNVLGEYLLAKGHTLVSCVFKEDDRQGRDRYRGLSDAFQRAGFAISGDRAAWFTTENRDALLAAKLLTAVANCTALACYNDEIAVRAIHMLAQKGIQAPEQVEVVSFDNSIYAQLSPAPFLSLEHPKEQLGKLAAQKMMRILSHTAEETAILHWIYSA